MERRQGLVGESMVPQVWLGGSKKPWFAIAQQCVLVRNIY